jgi:oligopeptide transport system permease protein
MKLLNKNFALYCSLFFLLSVVGLAVLAPYIAPFNYAEQHIASRLQGPSLTHWMGTDALGRDLYSRLLFGARLSLSVGFLSAFVALILGSWVGSMAGFYGGLTDSILMRVVDLFYAFPAPLLAILLMLVFGRGFLGIFAALSITSWVNQARIVRGQVLQIHLQPYVEAARSLGASSPRILIRHILPNCLGPIIASFSMQIPTNIMTESFLSFIGLGLQPPLSSWGTLANDGLQAMQSFPHLIIFPGGILFCTMLALNHLGETLATLDKRGTLR